MTPNKGKPLPVADSKYRFLKRKDNDYDQLVFNIRFLILALNFSLNIFGCIFRSNYSSQLVLVTFLAQAFHLYTLCYHDNNYLICASYQVTILVFIFGHGSDPNNFLATPISTLSCFVLYSIQFYPIIMNIFFVALTSQIMSRHREHGIELFSSNQDLSVLLAMGVRSWVTASFVIFLSINTFQYYNAKIWKNFFKVKQELLEKNQELQEANVKMEEMVLDLKETNLRLEHTNTNLGEALKSQDLFVACVSHELRTPLNAMLGNIELLLLEQFDINKKKMLKTCQLCGEILLVLINNILDVAKINASSLEINVSVMNTHSFIEKIWSVSRTRILQKDLYGKLMISKNVPLWLKGDFYRLIQIIINLVGNATKFTTQGGVRVLVNWEENHLSEESQFETAPDDRSIHYRRFSDIPSEYDNYNKRSTINEIYTFPSTIATIGRIKQEQWIVYSEKDDDFSTLQSQLGIPLQKTGMLNIQVIDTGCGISPEAQGRIFQPFMQADSSITRKYGGTGLGLYIIKELVNKMNGTISVSSEVEKGARFTIKIPMSTISFEEAYQTKTSVFPTCTIPSNKTLSPVLIVDDSHYNQNIIKTYLNTLNIPSDTADNGLEALNKIQARPDYYSMIMMDIQMPVMDGITSSKLIRRHEKNIKSYNPIPIIVVTANCSSAEQNECMDPNGEIKAAYFYRKPFFYNDCKMSVEALLARGKSRKRKVLVVDDDAFNRELLQVQVRKFGLECETCKNGTEALRKVREDRDIAVIMLDFEMPDMNGIEVARRIRNELKVKDVFIVGTTGNVGEEMNKMSIANGMNKVLTKPISIDQISMLFKELNLIQ